jgi:hypothetical protein
LPFLKQETKDIIYYDQQTKTPGKIHPEIYFQIPTNQNQNQIPTTPTSHPLPPKMA